MITSKKKVWLLVDNKKAGFIELPPFSSKSIKT